MTQTRQLYDIASEARLIASVADTPDLYPHAASVSPDDFGHFETRAAWLKLTADLKAGRAIFLTDYQAFSASAGDIVPLPEFVREDARRILSFSLARSALSCASDIAKAAYAAEEDGIRAALARAADVAAARTVDTLIAYREAIEELRDEIDNPEAAERARVLTGIKPLDFALGIERQTLTILMARPSIGKTSLLAQISDTASEAGQVVAVFTKEESRRQWARRISFRRAGISIQDFKAGKLSDDQLRKLSAEFSAAYDRDTLWLDSEPTQTTDQIAAACEGLKAKYGRLDLVMVDHVRHLADKADNETHRMGRITWGLKVLAKRLNCAVIAAAQLSRGVEGQSDKRPDLKDLRDSGEIEENADNVIGLYREKYYTPAADDITAEILIRKCREGQRNAVVKMGFIESTMAFVPLAKDNDQKSTLGNRAGATGAGRTHSHYSSRDD